MTPQEQSIFDAIIAALKTNGRTIAQLTPVTALTDNDWFELDGGKRISGATIRALISSLISTDRSAIQTIIERRAITSAEVTSDADGISLTLHSVDRDIAATLPAATASKAGLLSSHQKQAYDTAIERLTTAATHHVTMTFDGIVAGAAENFGRYEWSEGDAVGSVYFAENVGTFFLEVEGDWYSSWSDRGVYGSSDYYNRATHGGYAAQMGKLYYCLSNDTLYITKIGETFPILKEASASMQRYYSLSEQVSLLTPQQVASEEEMERMIAEGEVRDGQMYFIAEE